LRLSLDRIWLSLRIRAASSIFLEFQAAPIDVITGPPAESVAASGSLANSDGYFLALSGLYSSGQ